MIALFEYFPGQTLHDHFLHNQAALSWNVRLRIAIECANALDYLARNKVVYGQMSSRNVILSQSDFTVGLLNPIFISTSNIEQIERFCTHTTHKGEQYSLVGTGSIKAWTFHNSI